jgi:hypothetical protein
MVTRIFFFSLIIIFLPNISAQNQSILIYDPIGFSSQNFESALSYCFEGNIVVADSLSSDLQSYDAVFLFFGGLFPNYEPTLIEKDLIRNYASSGGNVYVYKYQFPSNDQFWQFFGINQFVYLQSVENIDSLIGITNSIMHGLIVDTNYLVQEIPQLFGTAIPVVKAICDYNFDAVYKSPSDSIKVIVDLYNFTSYIDFLKRVLSFFNIAVIPVELISFKGEPVDGVIQLYWSTSTETNNRIFEIERKEDEKNTEWIKIGFVNGIGTTTERNDYYFADANITTGIYYYRLKQIDFDGSFEYSNIIEVQVGEKPDKFQLHQNYPNPFNPQTTIKVSLPEVSAIKISIYNMLGEEIKIVSKGTFIPGEHSFDFDGSNFTSGIYFYELETSKVILRKKMIIQK